MYRKCMIKRLFGLEQTLFVLPLSTESVSETCRKSKKKPRKTLRCCSFCVCPCSACLDLADVFVRAMREMGMAEYVGMDGKSKAPSGFKEWSKKKSDQRKHQRRERLRLVFFALWQCFRQLLIPFHEVIDTETNSRKKIL